MKIFHLLTYRHILFILFSGIGSAFSQAPVNSSDTSKLTYPLYDSKTIDLKQPTGINLANPSNIQRKVEFDPATKMYIIREKIGDYLYRPVQYLTIEEYHRYQNQLIKKNNWKAISNLPLSEARDQEPGFIPPIVVDNKVFEQIFGGTIIDIKPQVSAEAILSGRINVNNNPLLQENQRVQYNFDLNPHMKANVVGQVGTRFRVLLNYNTDAQFDFENRVKLEFGGLPNKTGFQGKDDDIIRNIEAGNVSFPLNTSLITGRQALFGLKTQLQFGRLHVTSVFSQQKSKQHEITIANGSQQNKFVISADAYEVNKHYFLSQYFRDHYNQFLSKIPTVTSNINITRVEVWITNKVNSTADSRDVLALMDLGENAPYNTAQLIGGAAYSQLPAAFSGPGFAQQSNNLLTLLQEVPDTRLTNSNAINTFFGASTPTTDHYAKLTYARKLKDTEYIIHKQLGYISLNTNLNGDEVLGVSFQYTVDGVQYQVGEFSNDVPVTAAAPTVLFVKLLKNETIKTKLPTWKLMMKNVYSLNAYQINATGFNLNIFRLDENTGINKPQITDGIRTTGKLWIQLTDVDKLNQQTDPKPDGLFDFLEGITIDSQSGRIVFPVLEPFGSDLRSKFDPTETNLISKYVFQQLYDNTQAEAQQLFPTLNRYSIRGTYQSQSGSEFSLNAINVPEGSVQVFAGTIPLSEGADFTVDYSSGRVRVLNQAILSSGQPIKIRLENSELFGIQQRNLMASRFDYIVNPKLRLGSTIMRLSERPMLQRSMLDQEPIANTIFGFDINYISKSRWLTRMADKLPFITTKVPSNITLSAEYAQLIPGSAQGVGYLDDFESARSLIDVKAFSPWQISGTPQFFIESQLTSDLSYGYNRARLAFYGIDPVFFTATSAPGNLQNNKNALSNHYVRQVTEQEIFPFKQSPTGAPYPLQTLDLAFYPTIRGPYNYTTTNINADGTLKNPENRWGGIFRKISSTDFEALNVEFVEIWMLDPFIYNKTNPGGNLYFNLGNISEDILKDGRKSLENGLPIDGDPSKIDETTWGKVPKLEPVVQLFSNDPVARQVQDIGLDGLNDSEERQKFADFLNQIQTNLNTEAIDQLRSDPSSDNYQFYKGANLDDIHADVLKRYERYNGTEGNSKTPKQSIAETGIDNTASTLLPDGEDINRDNNMTQADEYFESPAISIRPGALNQVGQNFVNNIVPTTVKLLNGEEETVNWIQLKIPIAKFTAVGGIQDFKSIRFLRMFMTGFKDPTIMRFAKLQLIRNEWRQYNPKNIPAKVIVDPPITNPAPDNSTLDVATIDIEEQGQRVPIPYVLPPGVSRDLNYNTIQPNTQLNEQSLALGVTNLGDGYSRAAFKTISNNFRAYRRIEMFIHAEGDPQGSTLNDNDISAFIRIGADNQDNYYEYEIPLKVTSPGTSAPDAIWPGQNNLSLELETFLLAKIARNKAIDPATNMLWAVNKPFVYPKNTRITILGQPDMSQARVLMLGIRNPIGGDGLPKTAQVWFDELRLTAPDLQGGWAATGRADAQLADFAKLTVAGNKSIPGFGSINDRINQRQRSDKTAFDASSNVELGKFFPERTGIKVPMYVAYAAKVNTPQYDPRAPDVELKTVLANASAQEQDAILSLTQDYTRNRSINFTNVRKIKTNPASKNHFWDVENISTSYAYTEYYRHDLVTANALQKNYRMNLTYNYTNRPKTIAPFEKHVKAKSLTLVRDFNFSLLPSMLNFSINLDRFYSENTLRSADPNDLTPVNTLFNKKFQMIRLYGLTWNLTRALQVDFNATNTSMIDEPDGMITNLVRDRIWKNLKKWGRAVDYTHNFNLTYNVPINKLPGLDWVNLSTRYGASFNWKAEPLITAVASPNMRYGNAILNTMAMQFNPALNLNTLYNKFKFIRDVKKQKNGRGGDPIMNLLTSIKNINASYIRTKGTFVPGFLPAPASFFSQEFIDEPGLSFMFGSQQDVRNQAIAERWITTNPLINQQYTTSDKTDLNIRAGVEPMSDLHIDLNATKNTSFNYSTNFKFVSNKNSFESLSPMISGSYNISFFTFLTAFDSENQTTNVSGLFNEFQNNRMAISQRLGRQNPNSTGIKSDGYADGYNKKSQEVIVPAFIAAYTGRDPDGIALNRFPTFPIPNWKIRYSGLTKFDFFKNILASIDIEHAYSSVYSVNNFNTLGLYEEKNGAANAKDVNGNFLPLYRFSQISIFEKFAPFLGVNARLKNNMVISFEYRKNRGLSFSLANNQLGVQKDAAFVFGVGARTRKFRFPFGLFKQLKLDNDLNFKLDIVINDRKTIIYRMDLNDAEVSSGSKNITINPSIDYMLDKQFSLRLFYNNNVTKPYTSQSFQTAFSNFGISIKFHLQ